MRPSILATLPAIALLGAAPLAAEPAAPPDRTVRALPGNTVRFGSGRLVSYLYLRPDGVARVREAGSPAEDQIWSIREDGEICLTDQVGYRCAAVQVARNGGVSLLPEQDRRMSGTLLRGNPEGL